MIEFLLVRLRQLERTIKELEDRLARLERDAGKASQGSSLVGKS
jgi:hypothetical protein